MLIAVATKSLKIVIFNYLMLVEDDTMSVTIPRFPNLVVDLKVSVALKKKTFAHLRTHFGQTCGGSESPMLL